MPPLMARRPDADDFSHQHHYNTSPLLGDEAHLLDSESVRSYPSSHHTADQSLLLPSSAAPPTIPRPQPHRLQRRNHYHYINGVLVPTSPTDSRQSQQQRQHQPLAPSRRESIRSMRPPPRTKSYSASGSGWPSPWTGERREIRKLQKEHPVGSARPSFALEIGEGDEGDDDNNNNNNNNNNNSASMRSSSMMGVKRRMERLRVLYRKGDKEVVTT